MALVARPIHLQDRSHRIGVSIGIARFPEGGTALSRPMRRADLALYRAKRDGRDCFAFSEDLPSDIPAAMDLC